MNVTIRILDPEKVECKVTVAASLGELLKLSEQLDKHALDYPAIRLLRAIADAAVKAKSEFDAEVER